MGIRTFTFGGTSSGDYNMFITSASTYGAPERAVEMIEIPGRNGHYALDQGRFENVEVTYHVVVHDNNNTSFQAGMSDVRNWLCSQIGYQRLEDDYNANEYRMAVYRSGLEVEGEDTFWNGAEFDIVFDCKPQRWLTSGETTVSVTNGGTVTNPTLFESEPLLAVKGYGNIDFNGYNLEIYNAILGDVEVSQALNETKTGVSINRTITIPFINTDLLNPGDIIHISGIKETLVEKVGNYSGIAVTFNSRVGITATRQISKPNVTFSISYNPVDIVYGTASTWETELYADITYTGGANTVSVYTEFVYNGGDSISITFDQYAYNDTQTISIPVFVGVSTISTLGDPTYLDCEIGEAYLINDDEPVTLNNVVEFGADLPKLGAGANTVTFDNTITELKMTPRWWKV